MGIRPLFRVTKSQASVLFKYLQSVTVSVNPWSSFRSASAIEFWRSVSSPKLKNSNPKCKIQYQIHTDRTKEPEICLKFKDGTVQKIFPADRDVIEILSEMQQHAFILNSKLEDEGKSIED